jgi:hypothetical protein
MTARTISVTAEWARRGKTPDGTGYRLLGCSDGKLSSRNFEEAINRFLTGTPESLPQVSVSYLTRADQAGGSYLALAVHEFAEGGQFDAVGREIAFLRYFCVPYEQLADDAISYRAMYQAFRRIQLPMTGGGPPQPVTLEVTRPRVPVDDYLARQVAALLLTRPVCVLGANRTDMEDRLRFIDTVMSLLPYGMRTRMSASTWTSPTYRTHRFRLFFSDTPRAEEGKDHVVVWGRPERTEISPDLRYTYEYLAWLDDRVQQPVLRLSELTDEFGFGPKQVVQMLERMGIAGEHLDYSADRQDLVHPAYTPRQGSRTYGETILRDCVRGLKEGNHTVLKSDIAALWNYAGHPSVKDDRKSYQDIIFRNQLLRPDLGIGRLEGKFYDALLRLAFGMPLGYQGYCELESCLGISPPEMPHPSLLRAIERGGMGDIRVSAIVLRHLGEDKLNHWLRAKQFDPGHLIACLADEWDRPHHAKVVGDVLVHYLRTMPERYDPRSVLAALQKHRHLAQALQLRHPGPPQYQVFVLSYLLKAAHGGAGLDRSLIADVLAGGGVPPTPALLFAVLLRLADPADAPLARELYVAGQLRFTELAAETRAILDRYTPHEILAPERPAIEQAPRQDRAEHEMPPRPGDPLWAYAEPPGSHLDQLQGLKQTQETGKPARVPRKSLVRKVYRPKAGEDQ